MRDRDAGDHGHDEGDRAGQLAPRERDRGSGRLGLGRGLVEDVGFLHAATQVEHEQGEHGAEQERHAPAPLAHGALRQHGGDAAADAVGDHGAAHDGDKDEAAPHAATVRGRDLGDVAVGGRRLTAVCEALDHAAQQQQAGGDDPECSVGRQQADEQTRAGHHEHGGDEDELAALHVGDPAEDDPAEGAHEEADREDGEGGQQRGHRVVVVEHRCGDVGREDRVGGPLVPLEQLPGGAGGQGPDAAAVSPCRLHGWCGVGGNGSVVAGVQGGLGHLSVLRCEGKFGARGQGWSGACASRSSRRRILPVWVLGSSGTRWISAGRL